MAYPKKDEAEKAVRQNLSLTPELMKRIYAYCQANDRPMSWVARQALDKWLKEQGF